MPGLENGGSKIGSSGHNSETTVAVALSSTDSGKSKVEQDKPAEAAINGDVNSKTEMLNGFSNVGNGGDGEIFKKNMSDLVEILSKLNPMAEEFVPPSLANHHHHHNLDGNHDQKHHDNHFLENGFGFSTENFGLNPNSPNGYANRRKRNNFSQGKRRLNNRTSVAQQEDSIRKTVYVSDIDLQVTEELLAGLFLSCGPVVDCRICGDPNSVLRFAFIEFYKEEDAKAALNLSGTILGYYPLKVMPSKTAIAPVNPTFLPRSEDEREMCTRTIYCTNIDRKITQADVKLFFESVCGEVQRLRLLGDYHYSSRIAFVEFTMCDRSPQLQWHGSGIAAHKGKPIKDTCSSPCSSPCNAVNHLRSFLSPGLINCQYIYIYMHTYSSTFEVLLVLMLSCPCILVTLMRLNRGWSLSARKQGFDRCEC